MKERYEFRLPDELARSVLGATIDQFPLKQRTRIVHVEPSDPLFQTLRRKDLERIAKGRSGLFYSWDVRRTYRPSELADSELVHVLPVGAFEPEGEECGTAYDESEACEYCGAGRVQTSQLALDLRQSQPDHDIHLAPLRRGKDLAISIADEIVVSDRFSGWLRQIDTSGVELAPVIRCRSKKPIEGWHQLLVTSKPVEVLPPTLYGNDPFDLDDEGEYKCPLGHVAGLNLLSELTIDRGSWHRNDVVVTRQLSGRRAGVLVPAPELLISRRLFRLMRENRAKGVRFQAAHLV